MANSVYVPTIQASYVPQGRWLRLSRPGTFQPGNRANPGGMTAEQRRARDLLNAELNTDDMRKRWVVAYSKAIDDGVAPILIDYCNRILGKPKEAIELSGKDGDDIRVASSREERLALLTALKKMIKDGQ